MGLSLAVADNPHWPYGGVNIGALLQSFIDDTDGSVMWDLQDASGAVAVAYNSALALGRDVMINGDFAADTDWTKDPGWTIAAGIASCDGTSGDIYQNTGATAKTWDITYTITARVGGSVRPRVGGVDGTSQSVPDTYTETITAAASANAGLTSLSFNGSIDNVTIKQTGILASSAYPGAEELSEVGDGTADKDNWTADNSAALTNPSTNLLRIARNGTNNPRAIQNLLTVGKRYLVTGQMRSDGNATPQVNNSITGLLAGTTSTDWQPVDLEFTANNAEIRLLSVTSTGTEYTEWRNLSITEVNPLNGDTTGATVAQFASGALGQAYLFDGTNDYVDVYSAEANSMFNPDAGTLLVFAKVSGAGVWTDGTARYLVQLRADASNRVIIGRTTTNNQIGTYYYSAGASKSITTTALGGNTGFFLIGLTWDKVADQFKMYLNGAQEGATVTGLGAWVGNLDATYTILGAGATTPSIVWDGFECHAALIRRVLTPAEIKSISDAGGTS